MKLDSALIVNRTGGEVRVALLRGGEPVSFAVERGVATGVVGNVYKGRVLRVVPGMQSAFVDVGLERAAFLFGGDVVVPKVEQAAAFPGPADLQVGEGDDTVVEARIILGDGEGDGSEEGLGSEERPSGEFSPAPITTADEAVASEDPRDPESTLRARSLYNI